MTLGHIYDRQYRINIYICQDKTTFKIGSNANLIEISVNLDFTKAVDPD
jgi:hypothetical protein